MGIELELRNTFKYQILDIPSAVISDRNASSDYASFYSPKMGMDMIDFDLVYARYWTDEDYFEQMRKKSISVQKY